MIFHEQVLLAPFTTLRIGGPARYFGVAHSEEDLEDACRFARERHLPLRIIGEGSNILVPDKGIAAVVVRNALQTLTDERQGDTLVCVADAGVRWDTLVDTITGRGAWGSENLAGIPGSVGGAVVQNIGAYGAECRELFKYADVIDSRTGVKKRISTDEAAFGYRTSIFKLHPELVVVRSVFQASFTGAPQLTYPDLAELSQRRSCTTPAAVALAVRDIRSHKFPHGGDEHTAGSFFKNPIITVEQFDELRARYPALPGFPQRGDTVKVPLAWILDHVLHVKGYGQGTVRLYEKQPIVVVARDATRADEVCAFVDDIVMRVHDATGITIEREVEVFGDDGYKSYPHIV